MKRSRGTAARWLWLVATVLVLCGTALAGPNPKEASDEIIFVGLRPVNAKGTGDLVKLAEAQGVRAKIEDALAQASHQQIVGHASLVTLLGKAYLVSWFKCEGKIPCISDLLGPLRKSGHTSALTAEYTVKDGVYHVKVFMFALADGTVSNASEFDINEADKDNPTAWRDKLAPLFLSGIRVTVNVPEPTCTLDGQPCQFEADKQTISTKLGPHELEVTKPGYVSQTMSVDVKAGTTVPVDIKLEKAVEGPKNLRIAEVKGPRRAPKLPAIRTQQPPKIDGVLDDVSWERAWLETNFIQHSPDEGKSPTEPTELRVLFDDEALYVGIRCNDSHPETIVARLTRRDRDIDSDKVQLDISSKNDRSSAFHFQVSAAGVKVDGLRFNDGDYSSDLDMIWYAETSRDNKGWSAEIKIPLVALRYNGDTSSFGFQVRRVLQRRNEIDEWSYVPRDEKGEVSNYGTLDDLSNLHAARLFQLSPYDARRTTYRRNQGSLDGFDNGGNIGMDMKLGVTPALTLDATINPDFGTVEADQVVLNLSNVETFFPEKRPFFLEGADTFATPFTVFYTRRIGRTPPTSANGTLAEPPPQGQVLGALKLVGVLSGRSTIAALDAVTASRSDEIQRMPGSPSEKIVVDPLTNFGVLRLRQEFASNSAVGIYGTTVNRFEGANDIAPMSGDVCPRGLTPVKGRCTSNAYTGGADTVLRTADGKWGLSAQSVASVHYRGPDRNDLQGNTIGSGDVGWGLVSEAGKYGGKHWLANAKYEAATPALDLNDIGFIGRASYQRYSTSVTWRTLEPTGPFLDMSYTLNGSAQYTWDRLGHNNRYAFLTSTLTFKNFWSISGQISPYYLPYDLFRDTRSDVFAEHPSGWVHWLQLQSDPRKPVLVTTFSSLQSNARGYSTELDLTLSVRPIPTLELDLINQYIADTGVPRWFNTVDNGDGSRTLYFSDLADQSFSTTLRGTYTFSPTLSLQTYVQFFADKVDYGKVTSGTVTGLHPQIETWKLPVVAGMNANDLDFRDGTINANVFLRWEFLPGSAFWFAYTRNQNQTGYDLAEGAPRLRFGRFGGGPSTDVFLVKLSYLWEPLRKH